MPQIFNVYCDESNHLENSPINTMAMGVLYCHKDKVREVSGRIKEIRNRHNIPESFEIKWTKISPAKEQFYLDLVDYFFDDDDLHFRVVVIDKNKLDHERFNQTHDDWYYKMYFELLKIIFDPRHYYNLYLDIKDTRSRHKVKKLREVLCNKVYDFDQRVIQKAQTVRSHEVPLLQLTDLLIGAVQFANRTGLNGEAKQKVVERIKSRSKYSLLHSTLPKEPKFNVFHWQPNIGL
mgnify:CR=1 FL=1